MYVKMNKSEVLELLERKEALRISRWDNVEKAENFYSSEDGVYTLYFENDKSILNSAYSTPILVIKIVKLPII